MCVLVQVKLRSLPTQLLPAAATFWASHSTARPDTPCPAPCAVACAQDLDPTAPLSIPGLANDTMEFVQALGLEQVGAPDQHCEGRHGKDDSAGG